MAEFTHFDTDGNAHMVDVGSKAKTNESPLSKGTQNATGNTGDDRQGTAKREMCSASPPCRYHGAKQTANLIRYVTRLGLDHVHLELAPDHSLPGIQITATCRVTGPTGVEMEAMTAVSTAALTVYDMCKAS